MLLLEAVARKAELKVSEEELEGRLGELAREHRMPVRQVRQQLRSNDQLEGLEYGMLQDKALEWVLERAQVVEVEPAPESETPSEG
jgi:FKBP-type peptidyl-prolyl cis-trans isomerase (trigger factor)